MTGLGSAAPTILLTGGTGSFGHAFVRRVLERWPTAVVRVFSRDEQKQDEMRSRFGDKQVRYLIGDVRDRDRVYRAAQGSDVIVHAAAMKQVPACEYNPFEAVRTNVLGAQNVIESAIDAGVPSVVGLSTDKAVNPVNIYGATKLCAEKIFIQGNAYAAQSPTRIACVRYGNVVASRGSVVPLFRAQAIEGSITITDRRMTRFWITLNQAVDVVFYALENMSGGEIFVPKIPSMKVVDLAEAVAPGVPQDVTGIRPGEKLHESLLTADESRHTVDVGDIYVILPEHPWRFSHPKWETARTPPEGFVHSSDRNDRWMTREELSEFLQ